MTHHTIAAAVLLLGAAAGCRADEDTLAEESAATSTQESAIIEGTPEAYGVIDLLNDASTTLAVLDHDVPLDRRAAESLTAHRDGVDGQPGTGDDDRYDDIAEVDAVPHVGPAALEKLVAYADAKGYVASGDDVLGVFDNVAYTVDEATATLAFVNTATHEELDVDVGLDRRAVDAIVAARAIESVLHLSELYYVGQSAMLKLRDYDKTPTGTKEYGDPCSAHGECETGLCAGLTAPYTTFGLCMHAWMAGTFENQADAAIGDDGASVESTIPVSGLATVPMDVIVDVDIQHPRKQDLVVTLHPANGPAAVLWNHQASPPTHFVWPSGLEGDQYINGDWTLEIVDTVSGQTGTLRGWSMWLSSRYD